MNNKEKYNGFFYTVDLDKNGIYYLTNNVVFNQFSFTQNKAFMIESIIIIGIVLILVLCFVFFLGVKVWEFIVLTTGPLVLTITYIVRNYLVAFVYYFIIMLFYPFFIGSYYLSQGKIFKFVAISWFTSFIQDVSYIDVVKKKFYNNKDLETNKETNIESNVLQKCNNLLTNDQNDKKENKIIQEKTISNDNKVEEKPIDEINETNLIKNNKSIISNMFFLDSNESNELNNRKKKKINEKPIVPTETFVEQPLFESIKIESTKIEQPLLLTKFLPNNFFFDNANIITFVDVII